MKSLHRSKYFYGIGILYTIKEEECEGIDNCIEFQYIQKPDMPANTRGLKETDKKPVMFNIKTEIHKSPYTRHLLFTLLATALGCHLQQGYNMGNVNTSEKVIKQFYNKTYYSRNGESMPDSLVTLLWAVTVSSFCVGGVIGCALTLPLGARFGRKTIILWNNVLAIVGAGLMACSKYAHSYELLMAGRILAGVQSGIATGVAPLYLSEIAPVAIRGFCGAVAPLSLVIGVLIGTMVGAREGLGTEELWPFIFALLAVPAVFSFSALYYCPESPRYLMLTKEEDYSACKAMKWFRQSNNVSSEMESMMKERLQMQNTTEFKFTNLWRLPELRRPFIISIVLQLSLQFSGMSALVFYSTGIFQIANLPVTTAQIATIGTQVLNVFTILVSGAIIDKTGRRTMQLIGLTGIFLSTIVLVICLVLQTSFPWLADIAIACVFIFFIFFAFGPGSVSWLMVAELFDQGPRAAATSIAFIVNWLSLFIGAFIYPLLQDAIGVYSFLPFSGCLLCFIIFTYVFLPETKGKTILEITNMFKELTRKNRKLKPASEKTALLWS